MTYSEPLFPPGATRMAVGNVVAINRPAGPPRRLRMHSIRKFVGRGALALGLSVLVALAFAVHAGEAAKSTRSLQLAGSVHGQINQTGAVQTHTLTVAPSAACTAATQAIKTRFTN